MTNKTEKAKGQDERSVGQSELMDWLDPSFVAKGIDDEPEFTDEMPDGMWQALKELVEENDREGMTEAFRETVRLTKQGIKERLGV